MKTKQPIQINLADVARALAKRLRIPLDQAQRIAERRFAADREQPSATTPGEAARTLAARTGVDLAAAQRVIERARLTAQARAYARGNGVTEHEALQTLILASEEKRPMRGIAPPDEATARRAAANHARHLYVSTSLPKPSRIALVTMRLMREGLPSDRAGELAREATDRLGGAS